jgi:hypothetical protein
MFSVRKLPILAAALVTVSLASAARAAVYEATYSVDEPGTVTTPSAQVMADPAFGWYGYGFAYYQPTTDNHSGAIHITFDPLGHPGNTFIVAGWLSGDTADLTDTSVSGYHEETAASNPAGWAYWQMEVANTGSNNVTDRPFERLWSFPVPVGPGESLDFHWDVGPDVTVDQFAFVPEPASLSLLALGGLSLLARRKR